MPDQVSAVHGLGLEWQGLRWRAGYRLDRSTQDNRQPEREQADNANLVHGLVLELSPWPPITFAVDLGLERAENKEIDRRDRTVRTGVSVEWRATGATTLGRALVENRHRGRRRVAGERRRRPQPAGRPAARRVPDRRLRAARAGISSLRPPDVSGSGSRVRGERVAPKLDRHNRSHPYLFLRRNDHVSPGTQNRVRRPARRCRARSGARGVGAGCLSPLGPNPPSPPAADPRCEA